MGAESNELKYGDECVALNPHDNRWYHGIFKGADPHFEGRSFIQTINACSVPPETISVPDTNVQSLSEYNQEAITTKIAVPPKRNNDDIVFGDFSMHLYIEGPPFIGMTADGWRKMRDQANSAIARAEADGD